MYMLEMNGTDFLVAGFSEAHQVVQMTGERPRAKRFPTRDQAEGWARRYVGAGYGLTSFRVVEEGEG